MKKIMMTLVATVMALTVNAQAYVGGGVGVASTDDVTTFKFLPEVGFNLNEDWAVGAAFGWQGATDGGAKTWIVNPYARYTFIKGKMVNVFMDGGIGFAHTYNAGHDENGMEIGLKPGVAVNLGERLSFVAHFGFIGYNQIKNNNTKISDDSWGIDIDGNNILFGLYYNF